MRKKYKVEYLPVAQKDLIEIIEYIRTDKPDAALNFLSRFDNAVAKLEDFPLLGHIPKDNRLRCLNYRILIINSYLVFYVIKGNMVEIRRILHGKRKYSFLLNP